MGESRGAGRNSGLQKFDIVRQTQHNKQALNIRERSWLINVIINIIIMVNNSA